MKNKINEMLKVAMIEKDVLGRTVLRQIKGEITSFETAPKYKGETTDQDIIGLIKTMAKKLAESIALFEQGSREDLAQPAREELAYLEQFLPTQVTGQALALIVKESISVTKASGPRDMGNVMKYIKALQIEMDGKELSNNVKFQLGQL